MLIIWWLPIYTKKTTGVNILTVYEKHKDHKSPLNKSICLNLKYNYPYQLFYVHEEPYCTT